MATRLLSNYANSFLRYELYDYYGNLLTDKQRMYFEDYYFNKDSKYTKKQAKEAEVKMKHCFDIMQTLIFIFKEGLEK